MVDNLSGKLKRENIFEYSQNKNLNTILFEYHDKAQESGIRYDAYVEPGCVLEQVRDIDLMSMIGNLLDNAVAAVSKKECETAITIRIYMQKNILYIWSIM